MTWSDPIVEEVRRARDAYAARFNYDLRAIFRDLKEQERRSGRKLISCAQGATGSEPSEAALPTGPATSGSVSSEVTPYSPADELSAAESASVAGSQDHPGTTPRRAAR